MAIPKRLLMVDDDADLGAFVRDVAEPLGFAVEPHTRPTEFQASVLRADADVIIGDINMPEIDGIELLRFLARQGTKAKVLIMSGLDGMYPRMAATLGSASGLTIAAVVGKPVRAAELRKLLAGLMND